MVQQIKSLKLQFCELYVITFVVKIWSLQQASIQASRQSNKEIQKPLNSLLIALLGFSWHLMLLS